MLFFLTIIFVCQLVGELLVSLAGLPVPGPVIGMVILLIGLLIKGSIPEDLDKLANGLIFHLSLLFIPAGVGVMLHAGLLGSEIIPISVALVASTLITIAVTGGLMSLLSKNSIPPAAQKPEKS